MHYYHKKKTQQLIQWSEITNIEPKQYMKIIVEMSWTSNANNY